MAKQSNFEISKNGTTTKANKSNKVKLDRAPKLDSQNYHQEEIKQNKAIVTNAIIMIWVGIGLIIASFIVYVFKLTDSLLTVALCGCFIDLFSGTILYIFNKSNENKQSYFKDLSNNETEDKIIELVKSLGTDQNKEELIKLLIEKRYK